MVKESDAPLKNTPRDHHRQEQFVPAAAKWDHNKNVRSTQSRAGRQPASQQAAAELGKDKKSVVCKWYTNEQRASSERAVPAREVSPGSVLITGS